jgi:hypothetical protein
MLHSQGAALGRNPGQNSRHLGGRDGLRALYAYWPRYPVTSQVLCLVASRGLIPASGMAYSSIKALKAAMSWGGVVVRHCMQGHKNKEPSSRRYVLRFGDCDRGLWSKVALREPEKESAMNAALFS